MRITDEEIRRCVLHILQLRPEGAPGVPGVSVAALLKDIGVDEERIGPNLDLLVKGGLVRLMGAGGAVALTDYGFEVLEARERSYCPYV